MTVTLDLILLIAAFVCFVLAALGVSFRTVNFVAVGLALWVLAAIV